MQSDEMIWQVVNHQFCSYKATIGKAKSDSTKFCKHPYSVTGLCNRTSCPLANSLYATIRETDGRIHLYMKTVERAHTPKNMWEKIHLSRNYSKAIQQLDEHLQYFPKVLMHRNKQRLTKIHQYLIRMRKIELKKRSGHKAKHVRIHRKIEQREERREQKAMVAAKLEKNIEKELVERLAKGTYGDIYNFPEMPYQKALQQVVAVEKEEETEEEELEELLEEETTTEEMEEDGIVEYVEDFESEDEMEELEDELDYLGNNEWGNSRNLDQEDHDESESSSDEDEESSSDDDEKKPSSKKRKRGPRIEIEYEEEREDDHARIPQVSASAATAANW